jgi:hypothetical protein
LEDTNLRHGAGMVTRFGGGSAWEHEEVFSMSSVNLSLFWFIVRVSLVVVEKGGWCLDEEAHRYS